MRASINWPLGHEELKQRASSVSLFQFMVHGAWVGTPNEARADFTHQSKNREASTLNTWGIHSRIAKSS